MEYHYNSLLEEDPETQAMIAHKKREAVQDIVIAILKARYPSLGEIGQKRIMLIKDLDVLRMVAKQIATAPDEAAARWLLSTLPNPNIETR
jgi:hypothetical protein